MAFSGEPKVMLIDVLNMYITRGICPHLGFPENLKFSADLSGYIEVGKVLRLQNLCWSDAKPSELNYPQRHRIAS